MMNEAISLIVALAVIIVIVGLETFLSLRKSRWWGMIPVAVVLVFAVCMNTFIYSTATSYTTKTLEDTDGVGNTLKLYLRYDTNEKLVDFSTLNVEDGEGKLLDQIPLEFDKRGKLEVREPYSVYETNVKKMLNGRILTGYSQDMEQGEIPMMKVSEGFYVRISNWSAATMISTLPIIIIYIICRLIVRGNRRKEEVKRVQIESL